MLAALITAVGIALFCAVALAAIALHPARRHGPPLVGRTVVIHTRLPDDQTIRGVLHGQYADRWTLRDAIHVTAIGEQPIGGLQHIPVASISWAQEIEPRTEAK